MRRILLLSIALVSAMLAPEAARRPRYGGTLRIEMRSATQSPDAADWPLSGLVFETLVRLDDKGAIQPLLATSWTHDATRKRWIFTPRPGVMLHNGVAWEPGVLGYPD